MKHLSYSTISRVIESWDVARRDSDFDETVGVITMRKLFELEPRTKIVFGFPLDFDPTDENVRNSGLQHAVRMIQMVDVALSMLGPDVDCLTEVLEDLAKRHIRYGVSAHSFPFFGQAITYALSLKLGNTWTPELRDAWIEVYDELSGDIMKTIMKHT